MNDHFTHVSCGMGFEVSADLEPKSYGPVRLKTGRTIYRNYHRPIRGGLSLLDLCKFKAEKLRREMERRAVDVFAPSR